MKERSPGVRIHGAMTKLSSSAYFKYILHLQYFHLWWDSQGAPIWCWEAVSLWEIKVQVHIVFFLKTNFYWWASLLLLLLLVLVVVIILHQSPIHQNPTCERFVVDCPESLVVLVVVLLLVLIAILTQFRIARKTVSTEAGLSRSGWHMDIPVEDCLDCFNWGGHTQSTGGSSIPWVWAFNCLSSGGIINISKYTHVHCHSTPGCLR